MEKRRRFLPTPNSTAESSRDVSDPPAGRRTLAPGSSRRSLTSRLRVLDRAIVCARQRLEQSTQDPIPNAGDNSPRDPSPFPLDCLLQPRGDVVVVLPSHLSPLVALRSLAHRVVDFHAVLGGVNALRSASTVRSARPAGVDTACAPLEAGKYAMVEVRIAVDSTRSEAYVRNISHVPHGTPSTSSDVERFGMTLESLVPTAS